ncbi:hypothetical protein SCP_1600290 [Sparassis crispa]|uniref:Uncharacterized protein n=1 Tax=Sparassis crispa TaxID=139825 RepID=A0A401H4L0_9APHY|nr:hypothetical protein SCP_1600290 [Sparassis crispa]GBE89368.1 hypothetical protein SCP_1600290 [Sparassis crispa]
MFYLTGLVTAAVVPGTPPTCSLARNLLPASSAYTPPERWRTGEPAASTGPSNTQ